MKNLKLLLLVCVVLIIALLIIKSTLTKEEAPPAPETSKPGNVNVDEVYNQGGEVLEYDGYTYYVNTMERNGEFSNKVCRKAIGSTEEEVVSDMEEFEIYPRLMIYGNRIFYSTIGQTYWITIDLPHSYALFNKGYLNYIKDGVAYYTYNGSLYTATYYLETFMLKSRKMLVSGNCEYIGEQEGFLYYYSVKNETTTLFTVNLADGSINRIDMMTSGNVEKAVLAKGNLFFIMKEGEKNQIVCYPLKNLEAKNQVSIPGKVVNYVTYQESLYWIGEDKKIYQHDGKQMISTEGDIPEKAPKLYSLSQEDGKIILYQNGEEFLTVMENVEDHFEDEKIHVVGDYVYLQFNLKEENARVVKENKIYEIDVNTKNVLLLNNTFERSEDNE